MTNARRGFTPSDDPTGARINRFWIYAPSLQTARFPRPQPSRHTDRRLTDGGDKPRSLILPLTDDRALLSWPILFPLDGAKTARGRLQSHFTLHVAGQATAEEMLLEGCATAGCALGLLQRIRRDNRRYCAAWLCGLESRGGVLAKLSVPGAAISAVFEHRRLSCLTDGSDCTSSAVIQPGRRCHFGCPPFLRGGGCVSHFARYCSV